MKVLFAVGHPGFLRNFESGLRHLLQKGDVVHVLLGRAADPDSVTGAALQVLERLPHERDQLTWSVAVPAANEWSALAADLRTARDYWRYLQPGYDSARLLRARARAEAPAFAVRAERLLRCAPCRMLAAAAVHAVERRLPIPEGSGAALDEVRPDVLVVTPLLYVRSDQVNLVRAARARGIPVVYASGSWDHLTTKGLLHEQPDLALVWNEAQIDECVSLHRVERRLCRATGAQAFDHWFERKPLVDRAAFCGTAGVPADRPLVLYLCSSVFIAGDERPAVREWLAAIRSAPEPVRSASVIIRPHPQNASQWAGESFADGLTAVWPRDGVNPVADAARADFFHSIYFSGAVVGVNTSAQIESAILGRPVLSFLSERYAGTQAGTLHFRHLQRAGGGLLHQGQSLAEHVSQLSEALASQGRDDQAARFVAAFVRPAGLDVPAGRVFAEEVGRAVGVHQPVRTGWLTRRLRRLLAPLASASENARRLRATTAPPRFQAWFLPAVEPFRADHASVGPGRRVAWVVTEADDIEHVIPQCSALAGSGGRSLLCVPDGSRAGAAAKAAGTRLERCVVVGLPGSPAQADLLFRKFRATEVVTGHGAAADPRSAACLGAARRLGIHVADMALDAAARDADHAATPAGV